VVKRRQILVASLVLPWALLRSGDSEAQPASKVIVIGILDAGNRPEWWDAFRKRLSELGYVEGRNVKFELRAAGGDLDRLPAMAKDLVQLKVALIVTAGVAAASAAQRATSRIPIIMASGTDQVSMGLVASLAQPGRNLTGVSSLNSELATKRFELLRELVPKSSRLGVLWHADNPASNPSVRDLEGAATRARIAFKSFGIRTADELDATFAAMAHERIDAIFVVNGPFIYEKRKQIVDLANKHRIPAMYGAAEFVEAGGLVSYAPSYPEMFRHAADYVDKVLRGANPGTLPIEQPTKIDLVLNTGTAKALGLAVPPATMARADRVVQ
jgi:putative tryptophan/tyrosine transport system substrate-binding protein